MVRVAEASVTEPPEAKIKELIVRALTWVAWVNLTLALVVDKSAAYSQLNPAQFNNLRPLVLPVL